MSVASNASNGGLPLLGENSTSTSLRWSRKRLGVQRWQDGLIWGDAVPLWFSPCHARQPSVSRHAGVLFCAFPSLFCRPSSILRPIQSLTSDRWRSSRPVDRRALVLRASCRNLEQTERFKCRTLPSSQGRSSQLWDQRLAPGAEWLPPSHAFVKRIGETDSPACGFRINFYQLDEFSRYWRFLDEDKKRLCATQTTNRKAPTVTANTSLQTGKTLKSTSVYWG